MYDLPFQLNINRKNKSDLRFPNVSKLGMHSNSMKLKDLRYELLGISPLS